MPTIIFTFSKKDGKHYAVPGGGTRFCIGSEVSYLGRRGLSNLRTADGPVYKPDEYEGRFGHWAWFIHPTAQCESKGSFHCLNTYDRAAFTFTFMQFAAHVPEGDFVHFMRALLALPEAKDYFPFLELRNGYIWYVRGQNVKQLENKNTTTELMDYLNPDADAVGDQEIISAARMVYWAQQQESHRDVQIVTAVDLMKNDLAAHAKRFRLNGWPDYVCQVICDIFHQGRAKYQTVKDIMAASSNRETVYKKLLDVGGGTYAERVSTLKAVHKQLRDAGTFGKIYDAATNDFQ